METEIAVEHPKFDGYSYKFKLLGETECQVFKVFKSGKEKCLERGTFSKQQLMYDWINMKVGVFDKDLEKKACPKKSKIIDDIFVRDLSGFNEKFRKGEGIYHLDKEFFFKKIKQTTKGYKILD